MDAWSEAQQRAHNLETFRRNHHTDPKREAARIHRSKPCTRCGVLREVKSGRDRGLCADCVWTLNENELALWVA